MNFPTVGKGRKYDLQLSCAPVADLARFDCIVIVTDHSNYDYEAIVHESQLVVIPAMPRAESTLPQEFAVELRECSE